MFKRVSNLRLVSRSCVGSSVKIFATHISKPFERVTQPALLDIVDGKVFYMWSGKKSRLVYPYNALGEYRMRIDMFSNVIHSSLNPPVCGIPITNSFHC